MANNYLDNKEFHAALTEYKALCDKMAPEVPQVPEYIGKCFVLIATNLARRPNFGGYSWRDDMIGDGIETCLKYVKSFDPSRGTSPLGYFTTCCWYSFIGRITSEKKQSKIKRALVASVGFDTFSLQGHDEDGEFTMQYNEFMSSLGTEEGPIEKLPKEVIVGAIEGFME